MLVISIPLSLFVGHQLISYGRFYAENRLTSWIIYIVLQCCIIAFSGNFYGEMDCIMCSIVTFIICSDKRSTCRMCRIWAIILSFSASPVVALSIYLLISSSHNKNTLTQTLARQPLYVNNLACIYMCILFIGGLVIQLYTVTWHFKLFYILISGVIVMKNFASGLVITALPPLACISSKSQRQKYVLLVFVTFLFTFHKHYILTKTFVNSSVFETFAVITYCLQNGFSLQILCVSFVSVFSPISSILLHIVLDDYSTSVRKAFNVESLLQLAEGEAKFRKNVCIIGGGIAGLTCAGVLSPTCNVTIFESSKNYGFHVNCVNVKNEESNSFTIEAPPRSFNKRFYPNLVGLYDWAGIKYKLIVTNVRFPFSLFAGIPYPTSLSEYCFAENLRFLWLLVNLYIDGFADRLKHYSVGEYISSFSWQCTQTLESFIYPHLATALTCSFKEVEEYPMDIIAEYLACVNERHYKVSGIGIEVVSKILTAHSRESNLGVAVDFVSNSSATSQNMPTVHYTTTDGKQLEQCFDDIIIATEAHIASRLLSHSSKSAQLSQLIGEVPIVNTTVGIHRDESYMPSGNRNDWKLYCYTRRINTDKHYFSLYMNYFNRNIGNSPIFQTINFDEKDTKNLIAIHHYTRPLVNKKSESIIDKLVNYDGIKSHVWLCGSYVGRTVPLQEAAVTSAMRVCYSILRY